MTITEYEAAIDKIKSIAKDKTPIAFVVKPGIAAWAKKHLQSQSKVILWQIPIYIDFHQQDEILTFYDDLTLRCYLVRNENPWPWRWLTIFEDREMAEIELRRYYKEIGNQ